MSVPLDRLYHYIENIVEDIYGSSVIIYRFFPHGSKKFADLTHLNDYNLTWTEKKLRPQVFCNDQEPLNFDLYEHLSEDQVPTTQMLENLKQHGLVIPRLNFRTDTFTIWDHALLVHSELRSPEVEKYTTKNFLPVYYWSHAVIARDWFRYAEHVTLSKKVTKKFLIYARGWTGTREYRLKFLETLINYKLHDHCKTVIQPKDLETGKHYSEHDFSNQQWQPNVVLENYFATNNLCSTFSADFELADYVGTDIEIVLETMFDDSRLHFTEKILRPIALGQPFILAGAHGGLEYLKRYGFQTFDSIWDETYDSIQDPLQRMQSIVTVMKSIANWDPSTKENSLIRAQEIAAYNKRRFFSKEFKDLVIGELHDNFVRAFEDLRTKNTGEIWHDIRTKFADNQAVQEELSKIRSQQETDAVYEIVKAYRQRNLGLYNNSL